LTQDCFFSGVRQLLSCDNFCRATTFVVRQLLSCDTFCRATPFVVRQLLSCDPMSTISKGLQKANNRGHMCNCPSGLRSII
jgi:hypothetical protein